MSTTATKPAIPYHGGKGRMAADIAALLPHHHVYLEPFAGSAAVLLAKPRSTHEILNDIDGSSATEDCGNLLAGPQRQLRLVPDQPCVHRLGEGPRAGIVAHSVA